ncbi:MAG: hypothetical protein LUC43_06190, partial [Burkholderiales bacterium]|nr:hypothetical protein [Burkholderiales bacterium]
RHKKMDWYSLSDICACLHCEEVREAFIKEWEHEWFSRPEETEGQTIDLYITERYLKKALKSIVNKKKLISQSESSKIATASINDPNRINKVEDTEASISTSAEVHNSYSSTFNENAIAKDKRIFLPLPTLHNTEAKNTLLAHLEGFDPVRSQEPIQWFEAFNAVWYRLSDMCSIFNCGMEYEIAASDWWNRPNIRAGTAFGFQGSDIYVAEPEVPKTVSNLLRLKARRTKRMRQFPPAEEKRRENSESITKTSTLAPIELEKSTGDSNVANIQEVTPDKSRNNASSDRNEDNLGSATLEDLPIRSPTIHSEISSNSFSPKQVPLEVAGKSAIVRTEQDYTGRLWYCTYDLIEATEAYSLPNQSTFVRKVVGDENHVRRYPQLFNHGYAHAVHVDAEGLLRVLIAVHVRLGVAVPKWMSALAKEALLSRPRRKRLVLESNSIRNLPQTKRPSEATRETKEARNSPETKSSEVNSPPNDVLPSYAMQTTAQVEKPSPSSQGDLPEEKQIKPESFNGNAGTLCPDTFNPDPQVFTKRQEKEFSMTTAKTLILVHTDINGNPDKTATLEIVTAQSTKSTGKVDILSQASVLFVASALFTFQDVVSIYSIDAIFLHFYLEDIGWIDSAGNPGEQ